jgi:hypothetical protein
VIAKAVEDIPGAETVKVVPYEREKTTPIFRIVLAIAAVAAIAGVLFIRPAQPDLKAAAGPPQPSAEGVDPVDAARIGDIAKWHAMRPEEYDLDVRDALRGAGFDPNGRFTLDLDGNEQRDVVYLLASDTGKYRLVVLKDGSTLYDTQFTSFGGALPIPRSSFDQIQWRSKPRATAESDGVLVLTRSNGELQPSAFFFQQGRVISGIPTNWQSISFR